MVSRCISCGVNTKAVAGSVIFKCPSCSEAEITRCAKCRSAGNRYTCPKCGFVGP